MVAGIKHEKNFKGVAHYLGDLVTVTKVGRQNYYLINTPAVEGLSQSAVTLKETPSRAVTPAVEGVNTPAPADDTPALEGVNTPAVEGTNRTVDRTKERTLERTDLPAAPVATQRDNQREEPSSLEEPSREDSTLDRTLKPRPWYATFHLLENQVTEVLELSRHEQETYRSNRKDKSHEETMALVRSWRDSPW
jgi:hypothetical protein